MTVGRNNSELKKILLCTPRIIDTPSHSAPLTDRKLSSLLAVHIVTYSTTESWCITYHGKRCKNNVNEIYFMERDAINFHKQLSKTINFLLFIY